MSNLTEKELKLEEQMKLSTQDTELIKFGFYKTELHKYFTAIFDQRNKNGVYFKKDKLIELYNSEDNFIFLPETYFNILVELLTETKYFTDQPFGTTAE